MKLDEPDIRNSKAKNERPYHTKYEFQIPIDYICTNAGAKAAMYRDGVVNLLTFWTNVREFDASGSDKFQCLVHILGLLNAHPGSFVVPPKRTVPWVDYNQLSVNFREA
jgi:hypothetical protein